MNLDPILPAAALALTLFALVHPRTRAGLAAKPGADWALDLSGLLVQGQLVPWVAAALLAPALRELVPGLAGRFDPGFGVGFALNFVAVDYLYYWNHRALHRPGPWPIHAVHHTMTDRDALGTSRNPLWASFLIVYVWAHAAALAVLADPRGYLAGAAATAALDLWRHSAADLPAWAEAPLAPWLVLPQDHAWHHASGPDRGNYGANLKIWDRLHGTFHAAGEAPAGLGIPSALPLWKKLVWPW